MYHNISQLHLESLKLTKTRQNHTFSLVYLINFVFFLFVFTCSIFNHCEKIYKKTNSHTVIKKLTLILGFKMKMEGVKEIQRGKIH